MKIEKLILGLGIICAVSAGISAYIDTDPSHITTVEKALNLRDDTPVILQGKITKRLKKDKYEFTDPTGQITVEIDAKDWHGLDVRSTDTVRLYGEVDRDFLNTEIDVYAIEAIR